MPEPVIRTATVGEFQKLHTALMAAFCEDQPSHARFDLLMPETIRARQEILDNWYIAEVDGRIVASTQIVPQRITVAPGVELRVGGIGQVGCVPEFRNQGMMSKVLTAAVNRMAADGYDVSVLGGDRQRYRHYGFEVAGSARSLWLTSRRAIGSGPRLPLASHPVRFLGDPQTEQLIHRMQAANPTRVARTPEEASLILKRLPVATWVHHAGDDFAYICLTGDRIAEYGGEPAAFEQLLAFLLSRRSLSAVIPAHDGSGPLEQILLDYAGNYSVCTDQMLRVFRLGQLLERYRPVLESRLGCWNGQVRLQIAGEPTCTLVTRAADKLQITEAAGPADLTFDRPTWALTIFGPFLPDLPANNDLHVFLRQCFPLPFIWPGLSHI